MLVVQQFFILIMVCNLYEVMAIHINMEYILYSLIVSTVEKANRTD